MVLIKACTPSDAAGVLCTVICTILLKSDKCDLGNPVSPRVLDKVLWIYSCYFVRLLTRLNKGFCIKLLE